MTPNFKTLFWEIMDWGCNPNVLNIYHKIQSNRTLPYQLPEPWNGDLENAKIIFVGLNPSFNPQEFFPKDDNPIPNTNYPTNPTNPSPYWTKISENPHILCGFKIDETKVEEFFENRFSGSVNGNKYVNNNLQTLQDDGKYSKSVPYWKFVQNVMNYELKTVFNQSKEGKMGEDCALMEIVPCKSKGCDGNDAKLPNGKTCIEDFTDKIIKKNLSLLLDGKERLFVFVGKESCEVWYDLLKQYYGGVSRFSFDHIWYAHTNELLYIPGTNIKVVFAPHPSRGKNSINKYIYCRSKAPISF